MLISVFQTSCNVNVRVYRDVSKSKMHCGCYCIIDILSLDSLYSCLLCSQCVFMVLLVHGIDSFH